MEGEDYILIKNFIDKSTIKHYKEIAKKYQESDSKVGTRIGKEKKIRKDIYFNTQDCSTLDKFIIKNKELNDKFNYLIEFREKFKLGKYYGSEGGFYIPHTDTQGGMEHRKLSMVICISHKEDYEGGLFKFIDLRKEFKFDYGDAVFFKSHLLHGVEPVTGGLREVLISFLWDKDGEGIRAIRNPNVHPSNYQSIFSRLSNSNVNTPSSAYFKMPEHLKNNAILPNNVPQLINLNNSSNPQLTINDILKFNSQPKKIVINEPPKLEKPIIKIEKPPVNVPAPPIHLIKSNNIVSPPLPLPPPPPVENTNIISNVQKEVVPLKPSIDFHPYIISFSLWGDSQLYNYGIVENALVAKDVYPDYMLYVYHNDTILEKTFELLKKMDNVRLIKIDDNVSKATNMLWRFRPAFESDSVVLVRDSDSLINKREADATKEFLDSDYDLHIMRDNACHKYNILGGMWSARNGGLRKYKHMLDNFNAISDVRGADQKFMKKIYDNMMPNVCIHIGGGCEKYSESLGEKNYNYFKTSGHHIGKLNWFTPLTRELLNEPNDDLKRSAHYRYGDPRKFISLIPADSGPGNQVVGIKECLLIAKLINRTCLVPPIREHYVKSNSTFYPFNDIYKLNLNYAVIDDERHSKLNSEVVNNVYCIHNGYFKKTLRHQNIIEHKNFNEIPLKKGKIRNYDDIDEIKNLKDDLIIIKHLFNNVCISKCMFNGCFQCDMNEIFYDHYSEICSRFDFSENIKKIGNNFIKNVLNDHYNCIHIRLPDIFGNKSISEHTQNIYNEEILYQKINDIRHSSDKPLFIASNNIVYLKRIGCDFDHFNCNEKYYSFIDQYICCKADNFYYLNLENTRFGHPHNRSTFTSFIIDYRLHLLNISKEKNINIISN